MAMEKSAEYGPGCRYDQTSLIGVTAFFDINGIPMNSLAISDPVVHNKVLDMYFRGLEGIKDQAPPFFPQLDQSVTVPSDADCECVRVRKPGLALWTKQEYDAFPGAKGFYVVSGLAKTVALLSGRSEPLSGLRHYESTDDLMVVGFGTDKDLTRMLNGWYDLVKPELDQKLGSALKDESSFASARELSRYLLTLSFHCQDGEETRTKEAVLRFLLADDSGNVTADKISRFWPPLISGKKLTSQKFEEIELELHQLREQLIT